MPALSSLFKNMPELGLDNSKKRILLIYAVILLAALALYFLVFLKPTFTRLSYLIPKAQALRMEIKAVRNDLPLEGKLKQKFESLQSELGGYEKKLSREKEIPMLLESLSKMAKEAHVKILGIKPLDKTSGRQRTNVTGEELIYQEVPIVITAESGYHALGAFINKLENDERYMQVSDMQIKTSKVTPKRHDIEFVVYAYTFKGDE